jgi:hypothetical protein
MQEAVVADLGESARQHVLEKAPEKLERTQPAGLRATGLLVLVREADRVVIAAHDARVRDGDPEDVARYVPQGILARAHWFALDVPALRPDDRVYLAEQSGAFHRAPELPAHQRREREDGHEEARVRRLPFATGCEPASRHDDVYVRVVHELPSPRVEYRGETDVGRADELLVSRERLQGARDRREERAIARALIRSHEASDLLGHGEGDHEVRAREELRGLRVQPAVGLVVLARRAVPVAAGAVHDALRATSVAAVDGMAKLARPAGGDGMNHFAMRRRNAGAVLP